MLVFLNETSVREMMTTYKLNEQEQEQEQEHEHGCVHKKKEREIRRYESALNLIKHHQEMAIK